MKSLLTHFFAPFRRLSTVQRWLLVSILLMGLAFRLMHIDDHSVADHEATSRGFAVSGTGQFYDAESNGALFYCFLLKPSILLFGDGPIALRAPSLVFSMLGLVAVFALTAEIAGSGAALFACFFLACNGLDVLGGKFCRFYALNGFLCIMASFWLLKWLRAEQPREQRWFFNTYVFTSILCVASTVSSLFLLAAHWLYIFIAKPADLEAKKRAVGLGILTFNLYYISVVWDPLASKRIADYAEITQHYVLSTLYMLCGLNYYGLTSAPADQLLASYCAEAAILAAGAWGIFCCLRSTFGKKKDKSFLLPVLTFALPMVALILVSLVYKKIFAWQTSLFVISSIAMIFGIGVSRLPKYVLWVYLSALIVGSSFLVIPYYLYGGCGWKPKLGLIAEHCRPNNVIVLVGAPQFSYFLGGNTAGESIIDNRDIFPVDFEKLANFGQFLSSEIRLANRIFWHRPQPRALWVRCNYHDVADVNEQLLKYFRVKKILAWEWDTVDVVELLILQDPPCYYRPPYRPLPKKGESGF